MNLLRLSIIGLLLCVFADGRKYIRSSLIRQKFGKPGFHNDLTDHLQLQQTSRRQAGGMDMRFEGNELAEAHEILKIRSDRRRQYIAACLKMLESPNISMSQKLKWSNRILKDSSDLPPLEAA